jgi:decaprenylphospho-beta-D-ribofuranose 2-oxidase
VSTVELLAGWGRTSPSAARVSKPNDAHEVEELLSNAGPRGVIGRGLGRSYGDAAQNAGGEVALMTGLDGIRAVDLEGATVTVDAGVSLDRLMKTLAPLGLWPPVSPGTRQVSVGGAIASDVHGKGHHRDGTFGSHVLSMELVTPGKGPMILTPDGTPEEFWATAGGMGLTGLVRAATLKMLRIQTTKIRVDSVRTPDLESTMAVMSERDRFYRYSVAWIDCLARGSSLGRSIVELGDHAEVDEIPAGARPGALVFRPPRPLPSPPWAPLNRWTIAAFNELWYRKARLGAKRHLVPASSFFHPLDGVVDWNRMYGRQGFVQYQFVLPDGEEKTLRRIIEELAGRRCASFLAVLKRFGEANPGPLSFPRTGWTLALDLPASTDGLGTLLDGMDSVVASGGGRVYLAKDSRLRPDLLESMYPELPRWREVRDRLDPDRVMCSDLARRLPALS